MGTTISSLRGEASSTSFILLMIMNIRWRTNMKSHILCNLLLLFALCGDFIHARMFWMGSSQVNKDAPAAFNNGRHLAKNKEGPTVSPTMALRNFRSSVFSPRHPAFIANIQGLRRFPFYKFSTIITKNPGRANEHLDDPITDNTPTRAAIKNLLKLKERDKSLRQRKGAYSRNRARLNRAQRTLRPFSWRVSQFYRTIQDGMKK